LACESSRDNPTSPLTVWGKWASYLSITATDQAEQGNHDFAVEISGRRHKPTQDRLMSVKHVTLSLIFDINGYLYDHVPYD